MAKPASTKKSSTDANAIAYFDRYLTTNVTAAETLRRMQPDFQEFLRHAPSMCVWKCVDGRVHGSKAKGYPPGTITFGRTDGSNIDISIGNYTLWDRINSVVADARKRTPGKPALFLSFAHRSDHPGFGCAAHGCDDEKALNAVLTHAQHIRTAYRDAGYGNDLYAAAGMTNTDDMSDTLYFEDGSIIATADTIRAFDLKKPSDVFHHTGAQISDDLQTTLAMETSLLCTITALENRKVNGADGILHTGVFDVLYEQLQAIKGLPRTLIGALLYQCLWNTAYTLFERNRIEEMNDAQRKNRLDHAEELVCYGEGYETLPRNICILVKPGLGNDSQSLTVARKVLLKNRLRIVQSHHPLVHINVEVPAALDSWQAFRDEVEARMITRQQTVYDVFGTDVRILCTYSYKDKKEFYPIRMNPDDPRECYPAHVTDRMNVQDFDTSTLEQREFAYTQSMLSKTP